MLLWCSRRDVLFADRTFRERWNFARVGSHVVLDAAAARVLNLSRPIRVSWNLDPEGSSNFSRGGPLIIVKRFRPFRWLPTQEHNTESEPPSNAIVNKWFSRYQNSKNYVTLMFLMRSTVTTVVFIRFDYENIRYFTRNVVLVALVVYIRTNSYINRVLT